MMDALIIAGIIVVASLSGWIAYMLISGKKALLKYALAGLVASGIFLALAFLKSSGKIAQKDYQDIAKVLADIEKAKADVAATQANDKIRTDVASKADTQIKNNQALIDAIKKALAGG
jgi:hypothetical protein